MKVAFLTIVYPGVENYISDMLSSLKIQEHKNFDVFIMNDGVNGLNKLISPWSMNLNFFVDDVVCSPVKIREIGINKILDMGEYDAIIFGDSDDYFSSNRMAKSLEALKCCDIIFNDLSLVTEDKQMISEGYLSQRLNDGQILDYEYIKDKNVFGLSNTAISTKILAKAEFPEALLAFDWFFFSQLMLKGVKAMFCSNAKTYYRQHENNVVSMNDFSEQSLLRGIEVKVAHYKALTEIDAGFGDDYRRYSEILEHIKSDNEFLKRLYKRIAIKNIEAPLWWERACLPEIL